MPEATRARLRIHQDWGSDIPLKFLWTIDFSPRGSGNMSSVGASIEKYISEYENNKPVDKDIIDRNTDPSNNLGLLLAQSVSLPNENIAIGTEPLQGTGGFIAGYYGDRRADYGSQNKLDISFIETNRDVIDYFIKPWIIATSYKGLIEDGEDDLKCNISVVEYTRATDYYRDKWGSSNSYNRPVAEFTPRKVFTFKDCVPIQTEVNQLSYDKDMSIGELSRTVSFIFSHYDVVETLNSREAL